MSGCVCVCVVCVCGVCVVWCVCVIYLEGEEENAVGQCSILDHHVQADSEERRVLQENVCV